MGALTGFTNLSPAEQSRLLAVIEAAKAGDWARFASLTDRPFASKDSMQEQFRGTVDILRRIEKEPALEAVLKCHEDGSRIIFAKLVFNDPAELPIILTLHSDSVEPESAISIWTFYQDMDFS